MPNAEDGDGISLGHRVYGEETPLIGAETNWELVQWIATKSPALTGS